MEFRIVFRGQLVEGVTEAQAVKALSELIKAPEWDVVSQFFNAHTVIIKRVNNLGTAQQYQRAFRRAGIETTVEQDEQPPDSALSESSIPSIPEEITQQDTEPFVVDDDQTVPLFHQASHELPSNRPPINSPRPRPAIPAQPVKRRTNRSLGLKAMGGVGGLIILAIVSFIWLDQKVLDLTVPAQVGVVENALASKQLLGLAHLNLEKTITLASVISFDTNLLFSPSAPLGTPHQLADAGIAIRENATQGIFSLHSAGDGASSEAKTTFLTYVLLGHFPRDALSRYLLTAFDTQKKSFKDGREYLLFSAKDETACRAQKSASLRPRALYVGDDYLIISEQGAIEEFVTRIEKQAGSEMDIIPWQHYRAKHLVSAGLFVPDSVGALDEGLFALALNDAAPRLNKMDAIYMGMNASLFPLRVKFNAQFFASDESGLQSTLQQWRDDLQREIKLTMDEGLTGLAGLLEKTTITTEKNRLVINSVFNSLLLANLGQIVDEYIVAYLTDNLAAHNLMQRLPLRTPQAPDQIDYQSDYQGDYRTDQLSSFDNLDGDSFNPTWRGGPFGLKVKNICLDAENTALILAAEGRRLKNYVPDKQISSLWITEALDNKGKNLLPTQGCEMADNKLPAYFGEQRVRTQAQLETLAAYNQINVEKMVRLEDEASIDDVNVLRGYIQLEQSSHLSKILIERPFAGKKLQLTDSSITFRSVRDGKLQYFIRGDHREILDIRPMGIANHYIAVNSVAAWESKISALHVGEISYAADATFVEVIVNKQRDIINYPFELTDLQPRASQEIFYQGASVDTYTLSAFETAWSDVQEISFTEDNISLEDKPISVFHRAALNAAYFRKLDGKGGRQPLLVLRMPPVPGLSANLAGVEMFFDHLEKNDGTAVSLGLAEFIPVNYSEDPKKRFKGEKLLEGTYKLDFLRDFNQDLEGKLHGRVTLRFPHNLKTLAFESIKLGTKLVSEDYQLQITSIGESEISVVGAGARDRIIAFRVFNANGQQITAEDTALQSIDNGKNPNVKNWSATIRFHGTPTTLDFINARKIDSKTYPLVLNL